MVELVPIAGMLFTLLFVALIGGFILLYPLSRRLGQLIEMRLEERRAGGTPPELGAVLDELRLAIEGLHREVRALQERQEFTEELLEASDRRRLAGPGEPSGRTAEPS